MGYDLQFSDVWRNLDLLLWGAYLTLWISSVAMVLGLLVAIACSFLRSVYPKLFVPLVEAYVQIIRNTPFLVQIFLVYFGLPAIGIRLNPVEAGVTALVVNAGAYASEIIRSGVESIPRAQIESGLALGLHRVQVFQYIILPNALQIVYPALTSQFILLMLASSILSVISAEELTAVANNLSSQTFKTIEIYMVAAVIYLAMALGFSAVFNIIQRFAFPYKRFLHERSKG